MREVVKEGVNGGGYGGGQRGARRHGGDQRPVLVELNRAGGQNSVFWAVEYFPDIPVV